MGEISSAITTAIFNLLILGIAGNVGVAAYGVVANLSLIAMAIFNGISQGAQPLISRYYGLGKQDDVKTLLKLGAGISLAVEGMILAAVWGINGVWLSFLVSEIITSLTILLTSYSTFSMR